MTILYRIIDLSMHVWMLLFPLYFSFAIHYEFVLELLVCSCLSISLNFQFLPLEETKIEIIQQWDWKSISRCFKPRWRWAIQCCCIWRWGNTFTSENSFLCCKTVKWFILWKVFCERVCSYLCLFGSRRILNGLLCELVIHIGVLMRYKETLKIMMHYTIGL